MENRIKKPKGIACATPFGFLEATFVIRMKQMIN